MNDILAKNRSGWILHEYISIPEEEMSEIRLWDLKEDIGYVDELDLAIVKTF
ncbi:MAG: hypothetical protein IKZ69_05955 [Lachnospiraceae bacterium]|nr:hypothetical protein [Lachnospiraceae bacterium]